MIKGKNYKVLIFQNDKFLAEMFCKAFYKNGFEVSALPNYSNVIKEVVRASPDIILIDILVEVGINGYEAMKMLKSDERTKNIPLLVVDNLGQPEDIEKSLELGAEKHLIMAHYIPQELVEEVTKILEKYKNLKK